jgi:hypothetical protein
MEILILGLQKSSHNVECLLNSQPPCGIVHRPMTKGRITQQSSPERDEGNAFSKNIFLASREGTKLGTQPKFVLSWLNE